MYAFWIGTCLPYISFENSNNKKLLKYQEINNFRTHSISMWLLCHVHTVPSTSFPICMRYEYLTWFLSPELLGVLKETYSINFPLLFIILQWKWIAFATFNLRWAITQDWRSIFLCYNIWFETKKPKRRNILIRFLLLI